MAGLNIHLASQSVPASSARDPGLAPPPEAIQHSYPPRVGRNDGCQPKRRRLDSQPAAGPSRQDVIRLRFANAMHFLAERFPGWQSDPGMTYFLQPLTEMAGRETPDAFTPEQELALCFIEGASSLPSRQGPRAQQSSQRAVGDSKAAETWSPTVRACFDAIKKRFDMALSKQLKAANDGQFADLLAAKLVGNIRPGTVVKGPLPASMLSDAGEKAGVIDLQSLTTTEAEALVSLRPTEWKLIHCCATSAGGRAMDMLWPAGVDLSRFPATAWNGPGRPCQFRKISIASDTRGVQLTIAEKAAWEPGRILEVRFDASNPLPFPCAPANAHIVMRISGTPDARFYAIAGATVHGARVAVNEVVVDDQPPVSWDEAVRQAAPHAADSKQEAPAYELNADSMDRGKALWVLNLKDTPELSGAVIQKAWKRRTFDLHPDRSKESVEVATKEVQAAEAARAFFLGPLHEASTED